jgi:hypothetical protein
MYSSGLSIRSRSFFSLSVFIPWTGLRSALPFLKALLKIVLKTGYFPVYRGGFGIAPLP